MTLARPCCPRCMCWTWNLEATSSHTWTASRWAEASILELPAGDGSTGPKPDPSPCALFQFCGATIAGLSLLSPSVMRLVHTQEPGEWLELLLEPGSLYILRYCQPRSPHPTNHCQKLASPSSTISHSVLTANTIIPYTALRLGQGYPYPTQPLPVFSCRDSARYDFSHEILRDEESFFGERRVPRGRRISVICRSLPKGMEPGEPGKPSPAC